MEFGDRVVVVIVFLLDKAFTMFLGLEDFAVVLVFCFLRKLKVGWIGMGRGFGMTWGRI